MIEINEPNSKEMESALKALEQAKVRVANERKKLNEKKKRRKSSQISHGWDYCEIFSGMLSV